jgi:hypothetical protein
MSSTASNAELNNVLKAILQQLIGKGFLPASTDLKTLTEVLDTLKELGLEFQKDELHKPEVKKQLGLALICAALNFTSKVNKPADKRTALKNLLGLIFGIDPNTNKKLPPKPQEKLKHDLLVELMKPVPASKRSKLKEKAVNDGLEVEDELTRTLRSLYDGLDPRFAGKAIMILSTEPGNSTGIAPKNALTSPGGAHDAHRGFIDALNGVDINHALSSAPKLTPPA